MKLKYLFIMLFVVSAALPAVASRDVGFERKAVIYACELTQLQSAVLNQKWNKLAMRFFTVSMEKADTPYQIKKVRAEVDQALNNLRDEYGSDCVLDIL